MAYFPLSNIWPQRGRHVETATQGITAWQPTTSVCGPKALNRTCCTFSGRFRLLCVHVCADVFAWELVSVSLSVIFLLPYCLCSLWPSCSLQFDHGQWMSSGLLCDPGAGGLDVWEKVGRDAWDHLCRTRQLQGQEAVIKTRGGLTLWSLFFTPASPCHSPSLSRERNAPTLRDQSS